MDLPKRKHPRLKDYDYSSSGAYFITICTENRNQVLSEITYSDLPEDIPFSLKYSDYGMIVKEQIDFLEKRYPFVTVDTYVVMPDHIHMIIIIDPEITDEKSRRESIMNIICAYKSLTTKECVKAGWNGKLFQTSFYEHIIRNPAEYEKIAKYIYENPIRWHCDDPMDDFPGNDNPYGDKKHNNRR